MAQTKSLSQVWDSITLDLICIQAEGEIAYINDAGAEMLGATGPGQLTGKSILDFVHPDYREIAAERVRQVATERIAICPRKEIWLRLDGTTTAVEVVAMSIFFEGKPAVQLIAREDNGYWLYGPARNWRHTTEPPIQSHHCRRKHPG